MSISTDTRSRVIGGGGITELSKNRLGTVAQPADPPVFEALPLQDHTFSQRDPEDPVAH